MADAQSADTDVRRAMQEAARQYDLSTALKLNDLVQMYLKSGTDPRYIARRYGVDLERCERYVAALKKQEEIKREREVTARGDCSASESR